MNKGMLEQRLKDIDFSIAQLSQQIGWLQGGREEVLHWLKQIEEGIKPIETALEKKKDGKK